MSSDHGPGTGIQAEGENGAGRSVPEGRRDGLSENRRWAGVLRNILVPALAMSLQLGE